MTFRIGNNVVITSDRLVQVNSGTTRPTSPAVGMLFFNTSTNALEVWNGAAWKPRSSAVVEIPSAWAWGSNTYGRLGDGTTTTRLSPVSVVGGFTDWVQISADDVHTAGIRANGTAWCWGYNIRGSLGDNTTTNRSSPVSVVGGFTDWVQISAGQRHTAAIRANGTAWCWGQNGFYTAYSSAQSTGALGAGYLGNGVYSKRSPVSVVGGFTNWVQISAGFGHTAALRANGTAWTWGFGNPGQLGNNNINDLSSPVSVVGGFTDWVQISAGTEQTAAIRANGTAWCWGYNGQGQLGDGTTSNRSSPVSVVGGFTDWVQVDASFRQTAAIRANGTAWCWGRNNYGQLGDNSTLGRSSPVSVVGGFTDWVQISGGFGHTAALRTNGTIWSWGLGNSGQLGDNSTSSRSSPVSVVGGFTDWVQISGALFHTAALRSQPR